MNSKVKVSVIIPVYNGEKTIERAVKNIASQTYSNIEIVVVNDGSKDNTSKILNQLKNSYSNLVVCEQENAGVSEARNQGIKIATGEWIFFLDADDILNEECIEKLVENIDEDVKHQIIQTSFITTNLQGEILDEVFNAQKVMYNSKAALSTLERKWVVITRMFRAEDIKDIKFKKGVALGEDLGFIADYIEKYDDFCVIAEPDAKYFYMKDYDSVTSSSNLNKYLELLPFEIECYNRLSACEKIGEKHAIVSNGAYELAYKLYGNLTSADKNSDIKKAKKLLKENKKIIMKTANERQDKRIKSILMLVLNFPVLYKLYFKMKKFLLNV